MLFHNKFLATSVASLLALTVLTANGQSADNARFLSLAPPGGMPIIPVLEGWIANPDGTTSYSFGIINRNEEAVEIPLGEGNYIEPAKYDGSQPTHFPPGRTTGAFAVTVPESEQENDVWWYLTTGDSETLKVPGRRGSSAYELDFILPRPQGGMQPMVGVGENGTQRGAPYGLVGDIEDYPRNPAQVGIPVELIINATDPAERDRKILVLKKLFLWVWLLKSIKVRDRSNLHATPTRKLNKTLMMKITLGFVFFANLIQMS